MPAKKFPKLEALIKRKRRKRARQTWQEQYAVVKAWLARKG